MTRPTTPKKYAMHMWGILDRLKDNAREPVILRYPEQRQAKNMQLDFLAFRNACVADKMDRGHTIQGERLTADDPLPEPVYMPAEYPELNAYRTKVRFINGMWQLDIFHVDFTEEAKEVRKQLGLEEPQTRKEMLERSKPSD